MEVSDSYVNQINLDDPQLDLCGATCSWGVGNELAIVAGNVGAESHGDKAAPPTFIHSTRWNKDMHHEVMRKLLNESHQIFVEVQACKKDLSKGPQPLLIKFSRKYRSILRACVFDIKSQIEQVAGSIEEDDPLLHHMEILRVMEIIWNLCEILFFEDSPSGTILNRLIDWCKWHFTQADELTEECLLLDQPHTHELYWRAIKSLILQGRTEDAQNLLKLHPLCKGTENNAYNSLEEILRKMPHYSFYRGQSVMEFEMKWNHWQEECRRRFNEGEFNVNEDLEEVAMILCGNAEVFENPDFGGWYQMMVAKLLYTQPTVNIIDLQHHSKLCVEALGIRSRLGSFDSILLAAFELDPPMVIKECSQRLSNWWLAAHLADLFHHSGLLSQKKLDFGVDFREHLVLEYASGLISNDSFWRVTIDYLTACSENGNNYLPLFVRKIPLTSEKKAAKLLRICQKNKLFAEARSICRQMSVSALRTNRLGTALIWCLRSNDSALAMQIAEKMLSEYAKTGEFSYIDQLDYLGPNILVSDRLTFLGKYRDFHKLLSEGHLKDAGALLLNLLISKIAPIEFWPSLLTDVLPLLESDELVYNASDSAKLIASLNSLDMSKSICDKNENEVETLQKRLDLLRLYLSRNMARAIITT